MVSTNKLAHFGASEHSIFVSLSLGSHQDNKVLSELSRCGLAHRLGPHSLDGDGAAQAASQSQRLAKQGLEVGSPDARVVHKSIDLRLGQVSCCRQWRHGDGGSAPLGRRLHHYRSQRHGLCISCRRLLPGRGALARLCLRSSNGCIDGRDVNSSRTGRGRGRGRGGGGGRGEARNLHSCHELRAERRALLPPSRRSLRVLLGPHGKGLLLLLVLLILLLDGESAQQRQILVVHERLLQTQDLRGQA